LLGKMFSLGFELRALAAEFPVFLLGVAGFLIEGVSLDGELLEGAIDLDTLLLHVGAATRGLRFPPLEFHLTLANVRSAAVQFDALLVQSPAQVVEIVEHPAGKLG
jgi:hypothetical protein